MRTHLRKARIMLLSTRLWRKRLVFWCGAIAVGVIASYFALAADQVKELFDHFIRPHSWVTLLLSPLIFAFSTWCTVQFFPAARGSGIPQAMAARILRDPANRERLLGLKVAVGKVILTLLGCWRVRLSAAKAQLYRSVHRSCCYVLPLAGSARSVVWCWQVQLRAWTAAFNTPLAGIVFAIEEMARAFEHRNSSIVLIAIVLSGAAAMSILGNYDYFGYTSVSLSLTAHLPAVVIIGIAGGVLGAAFARLITNGEPFLRRSFKGFGIKHPVLFAAACGLGIALIGIMTGGITYGTGYPPRP